MQFCVCSPRKGLTLYFMYVRERNKRKGNSLGCPFNISVTVSIFSCAGSLNLKAHFCAEKEEFFCFCFVFFQKCLEEISEISEWPFTAVMM